MKFNDLKLHKQILKALREAGYEQPTPIQQRATPPVLEGRDLLGCAQTGTGKTCAFSVPIIQRLCEEEGKPGQIRALILTPTRELALQIYENICQYARYTSCTAAVIFGGVSIQRGADILIATPGRLWDLMGQKIVKLDKVACFVLDEADRMLDMGFFDDIMQIVNKLPKDRQTILFSATMPPKIRQLAQNVLRDPVEINVAVSKPNEAIMQAAYICHESQKMGIIEELFSKPVLHKTLIFASSKQKVKDLAFTLKRKKFNVAAMHSDLEQSERESVMMDFKNNKIDILVATDIVSRGIDIDEIGLVINFDVPHDPEDYIHRIGRTARASAEGVALTFVSGAEQGKFHRIEQFIEETIYKIPLPAYLGPAPEYNPKAFEHGSSKGRGRKPSGRSFVKKKNHAKREGGSN